MSVSRVGARPSELPIPWHAMHFVMNVFWMIAPAGGLSSSTFCRAWAGRANIQDRKNPAPNKAQGFRFMRSPLIFQSSSREGDSRALERSLTRVAQGFLVCPPNDVNAFLNLLLSVCLN